VSRGDLKHPTVGPAAVARVREGRPEDDSWRTDFRAGSHHSRWVDELRQPLEIRDSARAAEICGAVTRLILRDFAPALLLMPAATRRRLQALASYTLTLFDFARQTGLEGERLTAINRWEFDLEAALEGHPPGQPVYLLIAEQQRREPWNRAAFDLLHSCARRRSLESRPADRRSAEIRAATLARSLVWLLLGTEPAPPLVDLTAAVVRLQGLLDLGDDLRRHQVRLPREELADDWSSSGTAALDDLRQVLEKESRRIEALIGDRRSASQVPRELRAATRYMQRAARRLLEGVRRRPETVIDDPPRLGIGSRLALLLTSRWF
jgi:phytoene/squalene synthetase